jgi:RHS repeat-associated protein
LSKTRVWGPNEKILLHFRATQPLSEKQHKGCGKCSGKTVARSVVTYDYDAFGVLIHQTGTTPNTTLYSGEQFDPDLGLYYNRARYLNVGTGRFWNRDALEGHDKAPLSLNTYLYTMASPIDSIDPSGNDEAVEALGSLSIAQTIAVAVVVSLAYVCAVQIGQQTGAGCDQRDRDRTFYHGTSGYVAETIVQQQRIDPFFVFLSTGEGADYGAGFYMSESQSTAAFYAYFRAGAGQNGGPALVKIDIGENRWEYLVSLGAKDTSPVSNMSGQVQSFVPFYLIELFNLAKTRFSLIDLPPGPGFPH